MNEQASAERRQFSRVEFDADVEVQQDGKHFAAKLVDISVNGVLITTPAEYHIRTDMPCTIQVKLADDTIIKMQVALIHSSSRFLGFHCTSIDMDSITHLRRLIEFNLKDEGSPDRVLAELLKRHQLA